MSAEEGTGCIASAEMKKIWDAIGPDQIVDVWFAGGVTAVAVKGHVGEWAAYIGTGETEKIARGGMKLSAKVARSIFDQQLLKCQEYRP